MAITLTKPPYRATTGNWYTSALFFEHCLHPSHPHYTINPVFSLFRDKPGLINCQKTFVELRDPTGYKWCEKYLGDWRHWERLMENKWFREALDVWQENLRLKMQSEALEKIQEIAAGDSANALAASKYIAEEGWKPKATNRGRPSKLEQSAELKRLTREAQATDEDAERIGLRVINGDKS